LAQARWFKGNLHTHTDRSDGVLAPAAVVEWYASRGYDFLALTDHGRVTGMESSSLLLIPGVEITALDERAGSCHHLVALLEPRRSDSISRLQACGPQRMVEDLAAAGAVVVLAHPYWLGLAATETYPLRGAIALEVYNHSCEVDRGRGYSEVHWDDLLQRGRRLFGIACDDAHFRLPDAGGGYVMVRAAELTAAAILQSLARGEFYSTQGPEIRGFGLRPASGQAPASGHAWQGRLEAVVECSPCKRVVFYADRWLGAVVEPANPNEGLTSARYPLTGKETYVRAVCLDEQGRKAWSNPAFLLPGWQAADLR
jgi:hypothetical protein